MSLSDRAVARPAVFREPGALLYAGNCKALLVAASEGTVSLDAWTRRGYPGKDLGEALPQVCSVGTWIAPKRQNWGLPEHCNEGVKIAYVARGTLSVTIDGETRVLTEGQMFIVRPWQLHSFGDPLIQPGQLIWVLLDLGVRRPHEKWHWPAWLGWPESDRERLTQLLSENEQLSFVASREVARTFADIAELATVDDIASCEPEFRLTISGLLLRLMRMIESQRPELSQALTNSLRTVGVFLNRLEHALGDPWTLENMAVECGLSRTQFAKHCLTITGMTPTRYLNAIRLDAARELLATTESSVTTIAIECGFSSSQYFATCFRRRFGMTPAETRLRELREAAA